MRCKAKGLISIRHHKGVSHDQMPVAARFENAEEEGERKRGETEGERGERGRWREGYIAIGERHRGRDTER